MVIVNLSNYIMLNRTITCQVCGKQENLSHWILSMAKELQKHNICFECNHWRKQHQLDQEEREPYTYAIVKGHHYVLGPEEDKSYFRGYGGHKFHFKFLDGTIKISTNVWHQGDIKEAHPHWREIMPDNAEIIPV